VTIAALVTAVAFFAVLAATVKPLGGYMDAVFAGRRNLLTRVAGPIERLVYRVCRIDAQAEMSWKTYTFSLLALSFSGVAFTYVELRLQAFLPLNPQHFGNFAPDLAWNTAVSFATTTDWQFYSGESTMSYLSQMAVLAWQNFVAAAVGLAVAIALARGLARQKAGTIGNFWVDVTRAVLYVLLPLSFVFSLAFLAEGVPQNFASYLDVKRWTVRCKRSPAAPWHLKKASNCSAETVAASSAPTRVLQTRTPRRSRISCSYSRCFWFRPP